MAVQRKRLERLILMAAMVSVAACSRSAPPVSEPEVLISPWQYTSAVTALRTESCPEDVAFAAAAPLDISVEPAVLTGIDPERDTPGLRFTGGWHLRSPDSDFGGLSGLAIVSPEQLLAVTDKGFFVWLELKGGAPVSGKIAAMRDAEGEVLRGKKDQDAEDLSYRDGLALVSFERRHRILAFDVEACGANARGALVSRFPKRLEGMDKRLKSNNGVEGLTLMPDGELLMAIEEEPSGIPFARLDANSGPVVGAWLEPRGDRGVTGLDAADDSLYVLLRDYDKGSGNKIEVIAMKQEWRRPDAAGVRRLALLKPRHGTDNFEGIAVQKMGDGKRRLWMISDDNFSEEQRSLLFVFDITETP